MSTEELFSLESRIKYFRERKGYSQAEVAEKCGMNRSTFSNYETGYRTPSIKTMMKIAEVLEVEVGDLLGEKHYGIINKDDTDEYHPVESEHKSLSFQSTVQEKTYEIIEHYFYNTEFTIERPKMTALEFFKADKHLNELVVGTVMSTVEKFCQELNDKIASNPKCLVPYNELKEIPFRYKRDSVIQTIPYEIGKKEETEEYLEVVLEDYFYKLINIKNKKAKEIETKEEKRDQIVKDNEELAQIVENLKQELFSKLNYDLIEFNGDLPIPKPLQDNKEGE